MMAENEARCENCRYWHQGLRHPRSDQKHNSRSELSGECRRQPPVLVKPADYAAPPEPARAAFMSGATRYSSAWPPTNASEWCGEHVPLEAARSPMPTETRTHSMSDIPGGESA